MMKIRTLIFVLTLSLVLPIYGLATSATEVPATTVTDTATDTVTRYGRQFGGRWSTSTQQGMVGRSFVDANNDGLCDNCGTVHQGAGQGLNTVCENFVDADNDGVCDNFGTAQQGAGYGRNQSARQGGGRGMRANTAGANFADADNDGVCDNFLDADNDGVCDNAGTAQRGGMCGGWRR